MRSIGDYYIDNATIPPDRGGGVCNDVQWSAGGYAANMTKKGCVAAKAITE
jgi:hypothetical protein